MLPIRRHLCKTSSDHIGDPAYPVKILYIYVHSRILTQLGFWAFMEITPTYETASLRNYSGASLLLAEIPFKDLFRPCN